MTKVYYRTQCLYTFFVYVLSSFFEADELSYQTKVKIASAYDFVNYR